MTASRVRGPPNQAAAPGAKPSQVLGRDHQRLDDIMIEVRLRVADADLFEAAPLFDDFRYGLDRHIEGEEQFVLPSIEGGAVELAAILRAEHAVLRGLMRECSEALADTDSAGFQRGAAELEDLLSAHTAKEKELLYGLADAQVDPAELGRLEHWMNPV